MAKLLLHRLLALLAVAALLLPVAASAQATATQAHINDGVAPQEVQTRAGLRGLLFAIDVTLLDGQHNVVSSVGWAVYGLILLSCLALVMVVVAVIVILLRPDSRSRSVGLFVPEVKRRPPPANLDSGQMRSLPPQAEVRRAPPLQDDAARAAAVAREPAPPLPAAGGRARPGTVVPAGMPKACLSAYAPAEMRVASVIDKTSYTLGRRDGNDLVLPVGNKVGVSGRHATIKFVDGRYFIVDDNSTFGTFVNDQRLPPGSALPLVDGAIIGLGPKIKIQFRLNCP